MSKTRIIGDIHGLFNDYKTFSVSGCNKSIQLGDFGIGFSGKSKWYENVNNFFQDNPDHKFIRGNHDDPKLCKETTGFLHSGFHPNLNAFIINGAWSIDRKWRTEGKDWWSDEEHSISELNDLITEYEKVKPDVVLAHDFPTSIALEMFIKPGLAMGGSNSPIYKTRTGEALEAMFNIHQPKFYFAGHWHVTKRQVIFGTNFHCLGELDYIDFDLNSLQYC